MRRRIMALVLMLTLALSVVWGGNSAAQPTGFGDQAVQPSGFPPQAVQPTGFPPQAVQPSGFQL